MTRVRLAPHPSRNADVLTYTGARKFASLPRRYFLRAVRSDPLPRPPPPQAGPHEPPHASPHAPPSSLPLGPISGGAIAVGASGGGASSFSRLRTLEATVVSGHGEVHAWKSGQNDWWSFAPNHQQQKQQQQQQQQQQQDEKPRPPSMEPTKCSRLPSGGLTDQRLSGAPPPNGGGVIVSEDFSCQSVVEEAGSSNDLPDSAVATATAAVSKGGGGRGPRLSARSPE